MAVETREASLQVREADGRLELVASGSWTVSRAEGLDRAGATNLAHIAATVRRVRIDTAAIAEIDTYGALVLARLQARCERANLPFEIVGLTPERQRLCDAVAIASPAPSPPVVAPTVLAVWQALLKRTAGAATEDACSFLSMLGAFASSLLGTLRAPRTFRVAPTVHQLDRVGWGAVPIILLITFLIGGIIAQQGFFHFRKFGADSYVVDMVGILVLREIGVLIVSIMVAGRSGSAYTAELGSMKMREEIDALQTMGFDPVAVLVVPRIMALVIALPILAFLGSMAALYGGAVIAATYGGMSFEVFVVRLKEAISLTHFKVGLIKAPFMALVIGVVACAEGLRVRGSAESLGAHTTASVVKAIFLVIVLDGLFAIFFAAIGM